MMYFTKFFSLETENTAVVGDYHPAPKSRWSLVLTWTAAYGCNIACQVLCEAPLSIDNDKVMLKFKFHAKSSVRHLLSIDNDKVMLKFKMTMTKSCSKIPLTMTSHAQNKIALTMVKSCTKSDLTMMKSCSKISLTITSHV